MSVQTIFVFGKGRLMPKFSGSCLCGKIKLRGNGDINVSPNCHCTDCRRATGAVFATMLFIAEEQVEIEGTPSTFHHKSDRGSNMEKCFCSNCGSQVFGRNSSRPGILSLRAGIIDQTELINPTVNVFLSSKVASTPINNQLPAYNKMPN